MSNNQARRPEELLQLSGLFKGIAKAELEKLCSHCDLREYSAGSVILDEEAVTGSVYVIDSGDVVISRKENDQTAILARFLNGECFGELDLFSESGGPVTVRAESDSRLLVFPGNGVTAGELFAAHPGIGSKVIKNLISMVAQRIRSTNQLLSQRSPWVEELKKLVFVDKLTGLFNRTWLTEELKNQLAGKRSGTSFLIIKPDNFKFINDTYGHDAGDRTLSLLADTIMQGAENRGTAARHGGDVFAIVYKNANARDARSVAALVRKRVRGIAMGPVTGVEGVVLTASVGIMTRKPGDKTPVDESIQIAFDRMLSARAAGGDKSCGEEVQK
jgi:diguanylate cyclase